MKGMVFLFSLISLFSFSAHALNMLLSRLRAMCIALPQVTIIRFLSPLNRVLLLPIPSALMRRLT